MLIEPITRREMFMAKAGGQDVATPAPITREEMFLSQIGGSGGNVDQLVLHLECPVGGDPLTWNENYTFDEILEAAINCSLCGVACYTYDGAKGLYEPLYVAQYWTPESKDGAGVLMKNFGQNITVAWDANGFYGDASDW